ncbi:hypothetical protein DFH27DRAFT_579499 [Peziza echinospora]|nr:hypothetical protein DFH27DRAFT_579499 [Peziza echinospora]
MKFTATLFATILSLGTLFTLTHSHPTPDVPEVVERPPIDILEKANDVVDTIADALLGSSNINLKHRSPVTDPEAYAGGATINAFGWTCKLASGVTFPCPEYTSYCSSCRKCCLTKPLCAKMTC